MSTSSLAATGLTASKSGLQQQQQQQALLDAAPSTSATKSAAPVTRVAIRDGKMIGINDHIYLSPAWAPGAGEPYMIARVMEFVTAASSRSGAAALASSSGTLQVRANVFLRMRDISLRSTNDPRLLVATMHSDVFSLENVRGICEVRHRDLIGAGTAPDVSQWKKKEDHFYYYQLYDRYIHRFYDVVPTEKVQNAPPEVLTTLRMRYSFVVAEAGMINDLTDALRGCAVCHRWASGPESVRCDTCKKFFHMKCLNPPLASKPAKGYSWTCAPCSRQHEQHVEHTLQNGGQLASASASASATASPSTSNPSRHQITATANKPRGSARGRGRSSYPRRSMAGRADDVASATNTPDGTPAPEKSSDDIRGTRCFNRWPYRYFGQHTSAMDVLDPHDSVYPIATTRLGPKYQASLPTWDEQKEAGLGVHCRGKEKAKEEEAGAAALPAAEASVAAAAESPGTPAPTSSTTFPHKKKGRPFKRKREAHERSDTPTTGSSTPAMPPVQLPAEPPEFERGGDQSVEPIFLPDAAKSDKELDAYMQAVRAHFKSVPPHHVDLINRALMTFTQKQGDPVQALMAMSASTLKQLRITNWSAKEAKQFEAGIAQVNSDMKQLKKYIPTKKVSDIVRYFVVWKVQRIKADLDAMHDAKPQGGSRKLSGTNGTSTPAPKPTTSRAVSPSLSVYGDSEPSGASTLCAMCSTTSSRIWYKGPASLANRVLCVNCGLYWRKYAAETFNPDLVSVNTRNKSGTATAASTAASEDGLGVAPPSKISRTSRDSKATPPGVAGSSPAPPSVPRPEPLKCVMCKRIEPKKKLAQCRQCSLSVHQGCYGLTDHEIEMDVWMCDPCNNETTQEAALLPRCILCSPAAQEEAAAISAKHALSTTGEKAPRGRPKAVPDSGADGLKKEPGLAAKAPLGALDAFKPTECNNWAHVLCAVWMPEVLFSDVARLKLVESCGNLPGWRYEAECSICHDARGACVSCSDPLCRKTFHVACAHNHQPAYTLGFEIIPVKSTRRDVIATLTFKGESGHMVPQVWCKEHKELAKTKKLYDLAEVDPKTGLTSLQMFVRTNKHLAVPAGTNPLVGETTYALLRRAKRYDSLVTPTVVKVETPKPGRQKSCAKCSTRFSPFWWPLPAAETRVKDEDEVETGPRVCCNFCHETQFKPATPAAVSL
ncbi:PHD finger protein BR140/LIN-49 [Moesziomyces antarcticus T-34]|uniref:PHD finger protein BR140/LIN-49 n=1 Tax=Pseudozyma antarctica (strain T-34) TaxID=1151754 RepID=M9M555_PSEA3|nr:PHD finger protein BR140/LIN-49 [Moesziomyces antarcticus T-34]